MSMNFNIAATIDAYDKLGNKHIIFEIFHLWQTPSKVSYAIMEQENKLEAYCKWVFKNFPLEEVGEYTGTPEEIWAKEFNGEEYDRFFYRHSGQDQIDYVRNEVKKYISRGFEIKYYIQ